MATPQEMAAYLRVQMCELICPRANYIPIPRDIVLEIADMLDKVFA